MSLTVEFINQQDRRPLDPPLLKKMEELLQYAAKMENIEEAEVAVSLVDEEVIHQLNREYRGVDRPTDVLSFAMTEGEETPPDEMPADMPVMLGDIIISIPRAINQAEEYGHTFERELGFLMVHGFLHLLGYDHQTDEDEKNMFSKQEEILERFQLTR
ncbi:MAG: rRNA maturation RNase YbeY [Bacillaceae bacterium]|nr:rRNA maturation RNase YbeY [Bacillaceae bacterium]